MDQGGFYLLSEGDRLIVQQMLTWWRQQSKVPRNRPAIFEPDYPAPDVYVALTPGGGISALTTTGTAGTVPGSADCEIYNLINGALTDMGFSKTVYNLSESAIVADTYIKISRDKHGDWYSDGVGGGGACAAVLTPIGGIAGLLAAGTAPIVPAYGTCTVQEIVATELMGAGETITVYNLSTGAVAGSTYVLAFQDQFGTWWTEEGGFTGSQDVITAVSFDATSCVLTKTTSTFHYINGRLISIT